MASTEKNPEAISYANILTNTPRCDDYEKMISGMVYDSFVPELRAGRFRARRLIQKYNEHFPDDATEESLAEDRDAMLKELLGHVGKGVDIDPPFHVDYGCNISIGDGFYANFGFGHLTNSSALQADMKFSAVILDCAIVTIGDRTKFGPRVSIYAATHPTEVQGRRDGIDYSKEVKIGNDCWIGGNTVILPGVTIGDGVTVGASSVVTKSIPSNSIAVGSPARVIRTVEPVPEVQ